MQTYFDIHSRDIYRFIQCCRAQRTFAPDGRCPPTYPSLMRPMPNLENLKKQAKLYLRWHRDRYYPVAAQIRAVLPRFRHLSDQAVLAHTFKLSDAQELIARKAGFENWEALLQGVHTMTMTTKDKHAETLPKPTLLAAEPQLFVADLGASC